METVAQQFNLIWQESSNDDLFCDLNLCLWNLEILP